MIKASYLCPSMKQGSTCTGILSGNRHNLDIAIQVSNLWAINDARWRSVVERL
ncbi:hypothetical protein TIFTF001_040223 [Ficus carica]|uniref:Uncharacterized protein n=1 Tax=Ficus carica TaxID=3494 RepID=A0AA87ZCR4_FICCA|nr:hypothetical protein TIFTF001_040223 [Ficus carica]